MISADDDPATRRLAGLARTENVGALRDALPGALPWSTFLSADDLETFLNELVAAARDTVALDDRAPIAVLLTQWRHTAEVYADPRLLALVTGGTEGEEPG
ncbi:hypothetical protein [Streptomyces sp. CA-111067]|uniref:hypothetical protein n=1 Tax=Streptomyces sp. CA-111067 TaxID=3240046 RepID=UPI003D986984